MENFLQIVDGMCLLRRSVRMRRGRIGAGQAHALLAVPEGMLVAYTVANASLRQLACPQTLVSSTTTPVVALFVTPDSVR